MAVMSAAKPRVRSVALRGVLIALGVAAGIGLIVFLSAALLGLAVNDVVRVVAIVAGGYLLLNLAILAVGLFFKPTASWAIGAAVATPVIVAAIGFGWTIYKAIPSQ